MSEWLNNPVKMIDYELATRARKHQDSLTKPPGSLGQLEDIAIRLAAMQGTLHPTLNNIAIRIFAADHGVVEEGVSAFPQSVTVEMINNFANGGAAISVLAEELEANFAVVNMGTLTPSAKHAKVLNYAVGHCTNNFCQQQAMSSQQLTDALSAGKKVAAAVISQGADIFIGGEMGIGNTTSATALACAVLGEVVEKLAGLGTGIDQNGLNRKIDAIRRGLAQHQTAQGKPLSILQCLGGFEIAALVGAYTHCAQQGIPVLVDGFICTTAALLASHINPGVRNWLLFSHQSAEQGHKRLLQAMDANPILSLGMRLGEGSGAAAAIPIMRMACSLHRNMATFEHAGVSDKQALEVNDES